MPGDVGLRWRRQRPPEELSGRLDSRRRDHRIPRLNPSATPLALAMTDANPAVVRRAVFSAVPPGSKPAAVSTARLAGLPRSGSSYAILSTGDARYARLPNREPDRGAESGGPSIRGARDVTIMRIDLRVPRGANCLSFRYRFLSVHAHPAGTAAPVPVDLRPGRSDL